MPQYISRLLVAATTILFGGVALPAVAEPVDLGSIRVQISGGFGVAPDSAEHLFDHILGLTYGLSDNYQPAMGTGTFCLGCDVVWGVNQTGTHDFGESSDGFNGVVSMLTAGGNALRASLYPSFDNHLLGAFGWDVQVAGDTLAGDTISDIRLSVDSVSFTPGSGPDTLPCGDNCVSAAETLHWEIFGNGPTSLPPAPTPEPGTFMLFGGGIAGLARMLRKSRATNDACVPD